MRKENEKTALPPEKLITAKTTEKLNTRAQSIQKARARVRKIQRDARTKRLRELGEAMEVAARKILTVADVQALAPVLAGSSCIASAGPVSAAEALGVQVLAVASSGGLSADEALGAVLYFQDKLIGEDGIRIRARLNGRTSAYLSGQPYIPDEVAAVAQGVQS